MYVSSYQLQKIGVQFFCSYFFFIKLCYSILRLVIIHILDQIRFKHLLFKHLIMYIYINLMI